jgi:hypothetical protein
MDQVYFGGIDRRPTQADNDKGASRSFAITPPRVELPKGGGAIRGIGEKFAANPVTGTGSMSVPGHRYRIYVGAYRHESGAFGFWPPTFVVL